MPDRVPSVALTDEVKRQLKTTVLALRQQLEADLGLQLRRLGLDPAQSKPVPLDRLTYLSPADRAARRALDAVLDVERLDGAQHRNAIEALRREAAYTHLNRLVGLKCLELRGHLAIAGEQTEVVTCRPEYGGRSRWLWTLRERESRFRFGAEAEEILWREGLTAACAAVSAEIRILFDPADPYALVWPSHRVLRACVDQLNALPEDAFRADALLGWVYQYFQTEEKSRVFEQARTQRQKISGADIIPVTQLYTEQYMVEFLLQNSIGTRWMSMYGDLYRAEAPELGAREQGLGAGRAPGGAEGSAQTDTGGAHDGCEHSLISGPGSMAGGDATRAGLLRADEPPADERAVRAEQPDQASGSLDSLQHRRGAQPPAPGLSQPPVDRAGLAGRGGDTDRAGDTPLTTDAAADRAGAGPGRPDGTDAARSGARPQPDRTLASSLQSLVPSPSSPLESPIPNPCSPLQPPFSARWAYYVRPATPHPLPRKPLREWAIMDPAVGSGHFLVVAFDLLAELYAEERRLVAAGVIPAAWATPEAETARTILERNLHGIDIDARAVQLATLALYLKGVELGLDQPPHINLIAADAAFMRTPAWQRFVQGFEREPSVRRVLAALTAALADIRELGSLLQPEVELRRLIAEERAAWQAQAQRGIRQLGLFPEYEHLEPRQIPFEEITDDAFWENLSYRVERAIDGFMAQARADGDPLDEVVAGQAQRGFGFLRLCQRRYDVVCTNPPYMGGGNMGPTLKAFVAQHYAPGKADLYAAFILRCLALAQPDGHVAMVTQQSWMFLRSFADLRALPEDQLAAGRAKGQFTGLLRETVIETLAHLGPGAFSEIGGEVVNTVLITFRKELPGHSHQLVALRATRNATPPAKRGLLQHVGSTLRFSVEQTLFLRIPEAPFIYWFTPSLLQLMMGTRRLRDIAEVKAGMQTGDNERFLRYHWEVWPNDGCSATATGRWRLYQKGGRYQKWFGVEWMVIDWHNEGSTVAGAPGAVLRNPTYQFRNGLTYQQLAQGSLGLRQSRSAAFDVKGMCVFPRPGNSLEVIAGLGSSHVASFLLRALTQNFEFHAGYVELLPLPDRLPSALGVLVTEQCELKRTLVSLDPIEVSFEWPTLSSTSVSDGPLESIDSSAVAAILHALEGLQEQLVFLSYRLKAEDLHVILSETGTPAGWHPLLAGYDALPPLPAGLPPLPQALLDGLAAYPRLAPESAELDTIRDHLRALYVAGPGTTVEFEDDSEADDEEEASDDAGDAVAGARLPIPAETFIEELSQKLELHPISVYWLLEELRQREGLVCPPELQRQTADYYSVTLLRMLGHRWPLQDQYERERGAPFLDPRWIDDDGILPLTPGASQPAAIQVLRRYLDEVYGPERGPDVEAEAGRILGWKKGDVWGQQRPLPLERWLERDFFKAHVSQFKRRPIAWHLSSAQGAFQALVYYHKFDRNRLTLLRARYVRETLEGLQRRLGEAKGRGLGTGDWGLGRAELAEIGRLEEQLADVLDFDRLLGELLEGRTREARLWCPWKAPDEQPLGWDPDINDGVRVNIAPVQRLGLLRAPVLAAKDVKSLLAPEGRG